MNLKKVLTYDQCMILRQLGYNRKTKTCYDSKRILTPLNNYVNNMGFANDWCSAMNLNAAITFLNHEYDLWVPEFGHKQATIQIGRLEGEMHKPIVYRVSASLTEALEQVVLDKLVAIAFVKRHYFATKMKIELLELKLAEDVKNIEEYEHV